MLKKKATKKSNGLRVRIQPVIDVRTAARLEEIARQHSWNFGQVLDYLCALSEDFDSFKQRILAGHEDVKEVAAGFISMETETIEVLNLRK